MDDDAEFRDILLNNLEQNGILQKMRAKLRAHIYSLVDDDQGKHNDGPNNQLLDASSKPIVNNVTTTISHSTEDESIALSLVQDLLDCLNLTYTSNVLQAELKQHYNRWPRRRIADVLQIDLLDETSATEDSVANTSKSISLQQPSNNKTVEAAAGKSTVSSGSLEISSNDEPSSNVNDSCHTVDANGTVSKEISKTVATTTTVGMTPLLVEILRRLPKTTDESTTKEEEEDDDNDNNTDNVEKIEYHSTSVATETDLNNETFVTQCRSANQTSESL